MKTSIKADPGTQVARETDGWIEIFDEKRMTIWTLSKPSPVRPAAYICRRVIEEEGQIKIRLTAECIGQKKACDDTIGEVLAEQERATAPFRQR